MSSLMSRSRLAISANAAKIHRLMMSVRIRPSVIHSNIFIDSKNCGMAKRTPKTVAATMIRSMICPPLGEHSTLTIRGSHLRQPDKHVLLNRTRSSSARSGAPAAVRPVYRHFASHQTAVRQGEDAGHAPGGWAPPQYAHFFQSPEMVECCPRCD